MKPINIYAITRISDEKYVRRFEKQMSERDSYLHVKSWEMDGLCRLVAHLCLSPEDYERMEFYYSFQIPKLGKEFDLLQISEESIVNIELKSEAVSEEKIKKQLLLNKHYLASLGRNVYLYTYVSSTDQLFRLTHSNHLVEAEWANVTKHLKPREKCFTGNVEDLFCEDKYLISPLTDPDRFLRRDYFLTSQQKDIRQKILNNIQKEHLLFQGFTGLPGTGKTLLLYDIAMQLSYKQKVCVLHFGSYPEEMERLDKLLKRIDFFQADLLDGLWQEEKKSSFTEDAVGEEDILSRLQIKLAEYSYICVDEGHRVSKAQLDLLQKYATWQNCPIIFSYDLESVVSPLERKEDTALSIGELPDFVAYRLTNRIRTNSELSNFIQSIFMLNIGRRRSHYQSVTVMYAQNELEAEMFLMDFRKQGYIYLYQDINMRNQSIVQAEDQYRMDASKATCKEFENVVMLMDEAFFYDAEGYLRTRHMDEAKGQGVQSLDAVKNVSAGEKYERIDGTDLEKKGRAESRVRILFHGLSRAKSRLALVVVNNPEVFGEILNVIQGREK